MSLKAITITSSNQSSVATQYNVDLDDMDDRLPIGYILVAEFGTETYLGVIEKAAFDQSLHTIATLDNDYVEVDYN